MSVLQIDLGDRSYPIIIKNGILKEIGKDLQEKKIGNRYAVIADDHVAALYGDVFMAMLSSAGIKRRAAFLSARRGKENPCDHR